MKWQFWKRKLRKRTGGSSVAEQRAYNSQGEGAIPSRPTIECTPLCPPNCTGGELCTAGLVKADTPLIGIEGKMPATFTPERIFTSAETRPTITDITNPIDWRDSPIGSRWGPGRCNEACWEVHAYAVKTAANTVSFERPCEVSDLGAAEWRARQKR